eukprot:SAG31_NODE_4012_length_3665_cov_74.538138_1_plen_164_part_00
MQQLSTASITGRSTSITNRLVQSGLGRPNIASGGESGAVSVGGPRDVGEQVCRKFEKFRAHEMDAHGKQAEPASGGDSTCQVIQVQVAERAWNIRREQSSQDMQSHVQNAQPAQARRARDERKKTVAPMLYHGPHHGINTGILLEDYRPVQLCMIGSSGSCVK